MDQQRTLQATVQLTGDMPNLVNLMITSETPWRVEVDRLLENSWHRIDQGENRKKCTELSGRRAIRLKQILEFSSTLTTITFGVLMTFIFGYYRNEIGDAHSLKLIISSFITFLTFLSGLIQMLLTLNLLTLEHPNARKQYMAVIVLSYVSSVLLTLTSLSLLVLLPKKYAIVAFFLLPLVVILGLLIYFHGLQREQADSIMGYKGQKAELKRSSKLSSGVTTLSFGGMVGSISGYTKNVSDRTHKPHTNVGFFIIFFTSLSGLFSILLTLILLPNLNSPITRQRLITFIKFLNYLLLMLQAMTTIAFSHVFLNEFVLPAFFPTILGAMIWFAMEFGLEKPKRHGHYVTSLETIELKLISMLSTSVTSITFGGIVTIFTGYIGSQADSLHLNSCIFLMLSAFISSLSLMMLLMFTPPNKRSSILVVRILTCSTIGLLALAALDVILLVV